jgi:Zn-dependent metalloprotease
MVAGLGLEDAERIWFRALTHYLTSHSDFADAVDATRAAARDLGKGFPPRVAQAWSAVGLGQ